MPTLRPSPAHVALALGLLALVGTIAWQTSLIEESAYAKVGPRAVPWIVAAGFGALALALLWRALRGGWNAADAAAEGPVNGRAVGWFVAGLVLNIALLARWHDSLPPAGFILASAALYVCVARAFESPRPARDVLIGVAVSVAVYLAFDRGLGVNLGAGWLSGIL